tara:strand:- start:256 stop:945 length:690 start_codon:yes stop_codon:yes gene_type:complete
MKKIKNYYFPNWDTHFEDYFKKYDEYQLAQRTGALTFVKQFNHAVDVGGNVGTWARDLCNKFKKVTVFEPVPDNVECFHKNLENVKNYVLHDYALSDETGTGKLYIDSRSCGNVGLSEEGVIQGPTKDKPFHKDIYSIDIKTKKLDDLKLKTIDFMKIDVQGNELKVLKGAKQTLKNNTLVLCLELPTRNGIEIGVKRKIVEFLGTVHYLERGRFGKETIFTKNTTRWE